MAELTTVYFLTDDNEITKAIVEVRNISFFEKFGARRTPEAAQQRDKLPDQNQEENSGSPDTDGIEDAEQPAINHPDKGSGRPGSLKFHTLCVMEMQAVTDISDYLQQVTGQSLDARIKKIDKAQRVAVKTIKDWLKENDSKNT